MIVLNWNARDEGEGEMPLVPNAIQTQFVVNFVEADVEQCLSP